MTLGQPVILRGQLDTIKARLGSIGETLEIGDWENWRCKSEFGVIINLDSRWRWGGGGGRCPLNVNLVPITILPRTSGSQHSGRVRVESAVKIKDMSRVKVESR